MTSFRYAMIMSRLVNTPLLAHPAKLFIVYQALCGRFGTGEPVAPGLTFDPRELELLRADRPTPAASRFAGQNQLTEDGRGIEPFRADGGVGIITVTGSLINRGAWVGANSGQTSYEGIKFQLARAANDSRIHSVILDMHTPGGEANGALMTQQAVRALAKTKTVVALANGLMASAGYFAGSGATKVVTTPDGRTGSIGVVMLHLDHSAQLEAEGVKPTLIFSGAHKVDGNPFAALPDEVRAEFQGEVDKLRELFVHSVATARKGRTTDAQARNTEGRAFYGQEAVDAHLADEVGTFESVLAELKRKAPRGGTRRASMDNEATETNNEPVARADHLTAVKAARTEGHTAGTAEGKTAGKAEGIAEAHARLNTLLADPKAKGHEKFILKLALKAPGMPAADIIELAAEQPVEGASSFANRDAESGAENLRPGGGEQERGTREAKTTSEATVHEKGSGWADATAGVTNRVNAQKQQKQQGRLAN